MPATQARQKLHSLGFSSSANAPEPAECAPTARGRRVPFRPRAALCCKVRYQRHQSLGPLTRERQLREQLVVVIGLDEIHPAVLANPATGLRTLDPPAADALPRCHAFRHRIRILVKDPTLITPA